MAGPPQVRNFASWQGVGVLLTFDRCLVQRVTVSVGCAVQVVIQGHEQRGIGSEARVMQRVVPAHRPKLVNACYSWPGHMMHPSFSVPVTGEGHREQTELSCSYNLSMA